MVAVRNFCGRLIGSNETFANANLKLILKQKLDTQVWQMKLCHHFILKEKKDGRPVLNSCSEFVIVIGPSGVQFRE